VTAAEIPSWKFSFESPDDAPDAAYEDGVLSFKTLDGGHIWLNARAYQFYTVCETIVSPKRFLICGKMQNGFPDAKDQESEVSQDVYELICHILRNRPFNGSITAHKSPIKDGKNRA
jgi:hypothetical protein